MTHAPASPKEQRSFADQSAPAANEIAEADRDDLHTGRPGDADQTPDAQGRFGDLKQNLTNQWKVQDRSTSSFAG